MRSGNRKALVAMQTAFLNLVDEDIAFIDNMALSLGMMTDVGEENLELVRFLDREKVPTTDIAHECQRFMERITVLFERQGCFGVWTHCVHAARAGKKEAAIH